MDGEEKFVVILRGPVKVKPSEKNPEPFPATVPNVPLYAASAHRRYKDAHAFASASAKERTAQQVMDGYQYEVVDEKKAGELGLGARPDGKGLAEVLAEA